MPTVSIGVAVPRSWIFRLALASFAALFGLVPPLTTQLRAFDEADDAIEASVENLVRQNGCLSCHRAESPWAERFDPIPAPNLHTIGKRLSPEYLRKFLTDPGRHRAGATMPNLLAAYPPQERAEMVEDLVHYLGTRGGLFDRTPSAARPHEVDLGRELFHTIGCVVCHDGGDAWRRELGEKTTLAHIGEVLRSPERLFPSGAMPSLRLTDNEVRFLSLYLLEEQSRSPEGEPLILEVAGLRESYYEGDFGSCGPALDTATPVRIGVADRVGLPSGHREDYFAVALEGEIEMPTAGRWEFTLFSDDGSRLWIDGAEVIDHDGLHAPAKKSGTIELTAGWHRIRVTMFESGGGQELALEWRAPGQPIPELIPASAYRVRSAAYQPRGEKLAVERERRARGQAHYIQMGCAACHDRGMAPDGAKRFAELPAEPSGCLDPAPTASSRAPRFRFTDRQIEGLLSLLERRDEFAAPVAEARAIELTFDRLGCDHCHARDGRGGPTLENRRLFTGTAELGEEGRIPPDLTGVGAKLQLEWLDRVFIEGASVRPYMTTRMPSYAAEQVRTLAAQLHEVDGGFDGGEPPFSDAAVTVGRTLTGHEGMRCIDCHDFAGHPSLGEPAVDLATVGERLQPRWYREYMLDPQSKRPGTRMPAFWAPGLDLFPDLLEGSTTAQIDATWSYLSLGEGAPLPSGLVVDRRAFDLIPVDEPVLFGAFFEGLSGRVVCCGYPERVSIAYDVENSRLAKVWRGRFMNARGTWEGRAGKLETPEGSDPLDFPPGDAISKVDEATGRWQSGGRRGSGWRHRAILRDEKRRPIFRREHLEWGVIVEEFVTPKFSADGSSFVRTVKVIGGDGSLFFRVWGDSDLVRTEDGFLVPRGPKIQVRGGEGVLRRGLGGTTQLRVPIPAGGTTIEVEVEW